MAPWVMKGLIILQLEAQKGTEDAFYNKLSL
jgi:hypothetical protein